MAHNSSDKVLLYVGVVVLAMCICFDVYTAYKRGAKWIPGRAVVIYALCLQLIGYLDVQNVSIQSKDKDQQLEVLVSSQLSVDSSRLVLLVFVGYLLSNLASTSGFWTNIAALFTSLSTHIAIELFVAFQSRVIEKDRVVKGETGIWVIVSGMVLLESILFFSFAIWVAIIRGRFIRDNLGSRIPLALESLKNNNETISWDTCKSEMLKSWIVARVCQPEYVLTRSEFSLLVLCLVTFNVLFMGVKVIFLRSQLHGPSSLFTM
ncbi:hypothetical protein SUGI_0091320 [Cryptomeria japonica]|nr:hypothetical protein SUGI_0091320 [Cryptomeria japonica]